MARMKTFLIYLLLLVGFFALSLILEDGLLYTMYAPIGGTQDSNLVISGQGVSSDLSIEVIEAKASNFNGYIKVKIKNTSGHYIEKCCAKIDLYTRRNLLAATEYVDINNFEIDETRYYDIRYKASEIARYEIALVESAPDKSNILNILGWEFDLSNVFGVDMSRLKDVINLNDIKSGISTVWRYGVNIANSVPVWAYVVAGGIVLWSLPARFLFGIFPF